MFVFILQVNRVNWRINHKLKGAGQLSGKEEVVVRRVEIEATIASRWNVQNRHVGVWRFWGLGKHTVERVRTILGPVLLLIQNYVSCVVA